MTKRSILVLLAVALLPGCAGFGNPKNWIPGVIDAGRQVELVQEGFQFTEGPVGTADGGLYFTDLRASRVHYLDPRGKLSIYREPTGEMNGLALTPKGELVGVESAGKRLSRFNPEGPRTELTRGDGVHPLVAPNDLIVDAKGGIYFTDPHSRPIVAGRKHQIYYLPPGELKAIVVDESMTRPNGLTLTLDGKRLIVADTVDHVRSFAAGLSSPKQPLANTDFDTGKPTRQGEYRMVDETYAKLLDTYSDKQLQPSGPMRANILAFYHDPSQITDPKALTELNVLKAASAGGAL